MMVKLDLPNLKIATGRTLICICEAEQPMTAEKIRDAITLAYDKRHDDATLTCSLGQLQAHGLIDVEFFPTQKGLFAFRQLVRNKAGWALKFFRKSNSPNVGPDAPSQPAKPAVPKQHAYPPIPWLRPGTW